MWRDWFNFSRRDRGAILLLATLIVVTLGLLWTKPMWYPKTPYEACTPDSVLQSLTEKPQRVKREYARTRPDRQSSSMERQDATLPYPTTSADTVRREHPYAGYMRAKYKPGRFVDLNTADTAELMRIPGIGPVRARRIVEYRQSLGGYHSIRQVHEAYDLPEELGDWVHISVPAVKKLHINNVSLSQLYAHPYLTFYQARAIVELRKREGDIRSPRQLLFLDEFSDKDIERLSPYLSFE